MRVEEFYSSSCRTKHQLQSLISDKTRPLVLRKAVVTMCALLAKGTATEEILSQLSFMLRTEYEPQWFDFDWQLESEIKDDLNRLARFLGWLDGFAIEKANIRTATEIGSGQLTSRADLIVRGRDGVVRALTIHFKKADKSYGGKSTHTSTKNDLYMLVNKISLEGEYPGLHTALIYLINEDDSAGSIGDFKVTTTKKSNAFTEKWDCFYDEGIFNTALAKAKVKEILKESPQPDCYSCSQKSLCTMDTVSKMSLSPAVREEEATYKMPDFTTAQKKVVGFIDGPMLVCAGPGSGKTATLVGRIENLIKKGVPPELILAITFTREAAGELMRRCMTFCKRDEHPEILTLNALGYKILRENDGIVGKKVKLLTNLDRYRMLENFLSDLPPIEGFSYATLKGNKGLLATLDRHLTEYGADKEAYLKKHPKTDRNFIRLYKQVRAAIETGGYISYDEQITLSLALIRENPCVAEGLSARYSYIMVDEYQDVNEDQVQLIYALASHRNLVAVGDDDQSIYGFRGASNRYMLSFAKDFPEAERVVLKENFRSTQEIVENAQNLIKANKHRIDKTVLSMREKGIKPCVMKGRNAENVNACVQELLEKGVAMDEIAVLASKNATLEELSREVKFKTVLGKSYLRDNAMFRIILNTLSLHYNGMSDRTIYTLLCLMDAAPPEGCSMSEVLSKYPPLIKGRYDQAKSSDPVYRALSLISTALKRIKDNAGALYIIDLITTKLGADGTAEEEALEGIVEKSHIRDCKALYERMQDMSDFEDETKLAPNTSDAVILITSHESKGMEWKAVIMCDDYKDDKSEETNRLYYVAMTRAKDMLYILTENQSMLQTGEERREAA